MDTNKCQRCGGDVVTENVDYEFDFRLRDDVVALVAKVPLRKCAECEDSWLDHEAEVQQHEATCKHLGLLTPAEIKAIRETIGLNRDQFASLTGIGSASIARWESGRSYQSIAFDKYLRLLQILPAAKEQLARMQNLPTHDAKRMKLK